LGCYEHIWTDIHIAPANEAVEYIKEHKFRAALFNNTPYMGYPNDETDKLWTDLYDCKPPPRFNPQSI
jgi:hypothetical protein